MADWGTKTTRNISPSINRGSPVSFSGSTFTEYNLGTFPSVRSIGGGGSGSTTYIDRTLYTDAPPPTNATGDHGLSPFRTVLPVENTSQATPYPEVLYVVPAGCKFYVVEYELYNDTNSPQTPKLYFAQYPVHTTQIASRARVREEFHKILYAGQEIQGSGPSPANALVANPGVWCWISGILEVP